ncbi:MAG: hypothetical protein Q8M16_18075 [Pirellulaceae bacterium]|nr:hypothetical protein [Pirellulaceae bacterium]
MRLSLVELAVLSLAIGLTLVSLSYSNAMWETIFVSIAFFTILVAVLLAIATERSRRAYWLGFSISAIFYLGCLPNLNETNRLFNSGVTPTNALLEWAHQKIHPDFDKQFPLAGGMFSVPEASPRSLRKGPKTSHAFRNRQTTPDTSNPFGTDGDNPFGNTSASQPKYEYEDKSRFFYIGHCAWSLLFGWLGGHFTAGVYSRSRKDKG